VNYKNGINYSMMSQITGSNFTKLKEAIRGDNELLIY